MDKTAGDARDEEGVVDLELNGVVNLLLLGLKHGVELDGLGDGAGEAVEDEAVLALLVRLELRLDHVDHDVVRDKAAGVHNLLGGLAELGLSLDLSAEHVAGSEVADAVLVGNGGSLGALA